MQQSFHHCCSQDSFGGNTRTVMIANITAAQADMDETINTLKYEPLDPTSIKCICDDDNKKQFNGPWCRYASRAKSIKTKLRRNSRDTESHVSDYKRIIDELRNEVKIQF